MNWSQLAGTIKACRSVNSFKAKIKDAYIVPAKRYNCSNNRKREILVAKCRHHCMPTNNWLYKRALKDSKFCQCGKVETNLHYLLLCPMFRSQRTLLLAAIKPLMDQIDMVFDQSRPMTTYNLIVFGANELTTAQNTELSQQLHQFITHSHRF